MNKFDLIANSILEQQFIDMSVFDTEPEEYRRKRPGLYGRAEPDYSWKEDYKKLTRDNWLGFLVWNAIQAADLSQITSIPDIAAAASDFNEDKSLGNAAWLVVEIVFLLIGSAPGLEFAKNSIRKSMGSAKEIGEFFKTQILPRKQELFNALVKIPGGSAILASAKDAFSLLESETSDTSTQQEV